MTYSKIDCLGGQSIPFESNEEAEIFLRSLESNGIDWNAVGLIIDKSNSNRIICLLESGHVKAAFKICHSSDEEEVEFLKGVANNSKIQLSIVGEVPPALLQSELSIIDSIFKSGSITEKEISKELLNKTGRGSNFTKVTKENVYYLAHGRCMFTGCGKHLMVDEISGVVGNYGYLGHNIGSSQNGARGDYLLSGELSNDPENVLLLCDKHHRLVDKIAKSDYDASRLREMRERHILEAERLLDYLAYTEASCYYFGLKIGGYSCAKPSHKEIAESLSECELKKNSVLEVMSDNETFSDDKSTVYWSAFASQIDNYCSKIIRNAHDDNSNSVLFAFAPMPALIAIGAKIGNKVKLISVPRLRNPDQWCWPREKSNEDFVSIENCESLENCEDVYLSVELTAKIDNDTTIGYSKTAGVNPENIVKIIASTPSNAVITRHEDGIKLMSLINGLLHSLVRKGVKRVHLLPCAPNSACVYLGQAVEQYHPEVIIYDFKNKDGNIKSIYPALIIRSNNKEISISGIINEGV